MPIYLPAPKHNPTGVDGNGWNRIAIHGICNDECALRPKTITAFLDAQDTRRARYGMYDRCVNNGLCKSCAIFFEENDFRFFADQMLIRVDDNGVPWLMNRKDRGWEEFGKPTTWESLLTIRDVEFARSRDKFSDGVIMRRKRCH